jgi:hypothetical protein
MSQLSKCIDVARRRVVTGAPNKYNSKGPPLYVRVLEESLCSV